MNSSNESLRIPGTDYPINWIVLQSGHFRKDDIETAYESAPWETKKAKTLIENWKSSGESSKIHFNGSTYKLKRFDVQSRRVDANGVERPVLKFVFGPTDYITVRSTDLNIKNPDRNSLAHRWNITLSPVPDFATILGAVLNVVTSDGMLVIADKGLRAHVNGALSASVGEHMNRSQDADGPVCAPHPFATATRALKEELGITNIDPADIYFSDFGVWPLTCQYSLIGYYQCRETAKELEYLRSIGRVQDKCENDRLIFLECRPDTVSKFVAQNWSRFDDVGRSAVVLSLFQRNHTLKQIEDEFKESFANDLYIKTGDHFGAYIEVRTLLMRATKSIAIFDPYLDADLLVLIGMLDRSISVEFFTDRARLRSDFMQMIRKLVKEKRSITVYHTIEFHDRLLMIDDNWWHSGHSLKNLGERDSRISAITGTSALKTVRERYANAKTGQKLP